MAKFEKGKSLNQRKYILDILQNIDMLVQS